jgi:NAD-dependent dihydropyrimidine dehydrogenase PreA subunit
MSLCYLPNVVTLELDAAKCTGCRTCTQVCPHGVFAMENKRARIADRDACMECGACARNCPENAVSVRSGVGCAAAIITGYWRGGEPTCSCSSNPTCCG